MAVVAMNDGAATRVLLNTRTVVVRVAVTVVARDAIMVALTVALTHGDRDRDGDGHGDGDMGMDTNTDKDRNMSWGRDEGGLLPDLILHFLYHYSGHM